MQTGRILTSGWPDIGMCHVSCLYVARYFWLHAGSKGVSSMSSYVKETLGSTGALDLGGVALFIPVE